VLSEVKKEDPVSKWADHLADVGLLNSGSTVDDNGHQVPVNIHDDLHQRIQQATTWIDLGAILDDAQQLYEAGELTAEGVEVLASLAVQEAPGLPENS